MLLYQNIQHVTILIDCSPKILVLPVDRNEYFVHVPGVTTGSLLVPYLISVSPTKFQAPLAHRLIGDHDTSSCENFFDIAEAQCKAEVQSHRIADDLSWVAITGIRICCRLHLAIILLPSP